MTPTQAAPFEVQIVESLADAEPVWRALEQSATLTPYQRFDWLKYLLDAKFEAGGKVAIALVRRAGETLALLPLTIEAKPLYRRARLLGAEQSNTDWMVLAPGFDPSPEEIGTIFAAIGSAAGGVDLILVQNQCTQWAGRTNPLLRLPHAPAASHLYTTEIGGTPIPFVESRIPAKHRGNLRRGRRRLEEMLGPVRLVRVNDASLLERTHAVFLEQRSARFDQMGVDNVFASPHFRQFFKSAATAGFSQARPALAAYALIAGDEIVATCWGATAGEHFSLYINSTTSGPASRFSLMGILISDLMDILLTEGFTTFDLGLGDFDYKREWTKAETVYHGIFPLSARGRLTAEVLRQRSALKRRIKQDRRLWAMATNVRKTLFRLRHGGGAS